MSCDWKRLDDETWRCKQCKWHYKRATDKPPRRKCPNPTSRGLGDTVAKFLKRFGFRRCGGCKRRQKRLNELFPYK